MTHAVETSAALLAVSHGTSDPEGQRLVAQLAQRVQEVAAARGCADPVRLGHVDVQQPDVPASLASLPEEMAVVVVPLLLSAGFHVNVDLREDTADLDRPVTVGGALGPDDRLVDLLLRRMVQAGVDSARDTLIFAAAGSSDSSAVRDCQDMAARLQARLGRPVQDAYLSFAEPSVKTTVAQARSTARGRVVLISYLLAPGYFQKLLERAGADVVTRSLLPQDSSQAPAELVEIILDRFAAGLADLTTASQAAR
ncbi:cobalamin biosynthesis protein CbiX [Nesterenkonia sp. LB17]|uniref:sirohydrochlorin chelatase n=1 Tax=unclassified Nesterenkonia TaxID=2629769 RepID=UPI001F4D1BE6|nr:MULTISPECIES: CbiX/SirB N-terminal domain-containing protein [unclassified Nesterenkonia]MCH8560582.1 cobalamin biosynthesis protein CbiX [Nesterenkonia sp. DZ6]MCH8565898.1 cobalamin biosynthesis protein CbiX [Nesterenkonia sp. LB17]MCH8570690.1 cobalamin biosynthesis protein CbiX [Nesterenkonia sp. AY15]